MTIMCSILLLYVSIYVYIYEYVSIYVFINVFKIQKLRVEEGHKPLKTKTTSKFTWRMLSYRPYYTNTSKWEESGHRQTNTSAFRRFSKRILHCSTVQTMTSYLNEALKRWRTSYSGLEIQVDYETSVYTFNFRNDQVVIAEDWDNLEFKVRRRIMSQNNATITKI